MLTERSRGEGTAYDCIGFAEFSHRIANGEFSAWLETLTESIEKAAINPEPDYARLVLVQHNVIELIDYLDPDRIFLTLDEMDESIRLSATDSAGQPSQPFRAASTRILLT